MVSDRLVEGRECGDCRVCCVVPGIDHPALQKPSLTPCPNCTQPHSSATSGGCAIYTTRPTVCRDFHCAWRWMANLDDRWRPDRSGVFATLGVTTLGAQMVPALTLMLIHEPAAILARDDFIALVRTHILAHTAVFLSITGQGPGYLPLSTLLNSKPLFAAAQAGLAPVRAIVEEALRFLMAQPQKRDEQRQTRASTPIPPTDTATGTLNEGA